MLKNPPANIRDLRGTGGEDPLEEGMTTHSRVLAWRIPQTEEPGGLQSMESESWTQLKRLSTHTNLFLKYHS